MIDTKELRSMVNGAQFESFVVIHALLDRLEAAEKSDSESLAMYRKARDERDALRTKIAEMEKQEPVGEICCVNSTGNYIYSDVWVPLPVGTKLYTLPGTRAAPSVPVVTATAYRWRYRGAIMWQYGELTEENARLAEEHNHEVQPLYAEPISARSAPSIRPAALFPVIAWLRNGCDPMKAADELEILASQWVKP